MRHYFLSCGFSVALAACAASGSDSSTHGPIFGDDAGDDGSADAALDATHDAIAPLDAGADASRDAISDAAAAADASDSSADATSDAASCSSTMALVAGSATSLAGAVFGAGQWSSATSLAGSASAPPAIAAFGSGYVAVVAKQATTPTLQSTIFTTSWSTPAAVGTLGARDVLSLATVGANLHLVYLGSADSKMYHGTFAATWDGAVDPVGGSGASQSFGNSGPAAASAGGKLVVAQSGSNGSVYDQTWDSTWAAAHQQTGTSVVDSIAPTLVALTGGAADLLVAWVRPTDFHIMYSTRTGTTWSTPAEVYDVGGNVAYSNDPVSLAARPGGKAALVFRGGNMAPYATLFDGSAWSAPAALASGAPVLSAPPSVATGVCGDDAVAAYVTGGVVDVVRLSGTWSAPTTISGASGMKYAAIATRP